MLFHNRFFLYLISAQLVSTIGNCLDFLALLTLLGFYWNATPLEMTVTMACFAIPVILFGPLCGVFVDQFERKKMMIIVDLVRCIIVIGIIFASALWQIYMLVFLKSLCGTIFQSAQNGKLKEIVPDEQIQQAVSVTKMIETSSQILGPVIGGIVTVGLGVYGAFWLDAASFLLSAALLIKLPAKAVSLDKLKHTSVEESASMSFLKQFAEGLNYIKRAPVLLYGVVAVSVGLFCTQIMEVQIVVFFRELLSAKSDLLGLCMSASGFGLFLSTLFLSKKEFSLQSCIGVGAFIQGLTMIFMVVLASIEERYFIYPLLFFIGGAAFAFIIISFQIYIQKKAPIELIGRVSGAIDSIITFASFSGLICGGIFGSYWGIGNTYVLTGIILLLLGLAIFLLKMKQEKTQNDYSQNQKKVKSEESRNY